MMYVLPIHCWRFNNKLSANSHVAISETFILAPRWHSAISEYLFLMQIKKQQPDLVWKLQCEIQ